MNFENKEVAKKAIRKTMKTKGEQNQRAEDTHWLAGKRRDEAGTLSAEP
jgi:hypothetical protein